MARTGYIQIWPMWPDGSNQERVTDDGYVDWLPRLSPDSKWLVFLSYDKSVQGHPPGQDVMLGIMPGWGNSQSPRKALGWAGTIYVSSWSPDGKYLASVSNELLKRAA